MVTVTKDFDTYRIFYYTTAGKRRLLISTATKQAYALAESVFSKREKSSPQIRPSKKGRI